MKDEQHQNYGTMTGTPTLVTGATGDADQALSFDGSTNSMSVPDSPSDSLPVTDGGAGGMTLACFLKFSAIPASTKDIIAKAGSYTLSINSSGKLLWKLENGANSVTVTSATTIQTGQWYHFAGVYNGDYTGTPKFGYDTQGAAQLAMPGDYYQGSGSGVTDNLQVGIYPILEKGLIISLVMDVERVFDTTLNEWVAAVVYKVASGVLVAKVAQSAAIQLGASVPVGRAWVTFPINAPVFAGDVGLGFVGGSNNGQFKIGHETTGGTRKWRAAAVTDGSTFQLTGQTPDPFGTPVGSDAKKLSIYANYTPTGRTGAEGKALIYLNGVEDASSAYTRGIADSANALVMASGVAVQLDEPMIFNRKLTPVEIAYLYSAR